MQSPAATRLKLAVRGAVQGVGFRPFVYRLANELGLHGWIRNSSQGILLEIEGPQGEVDRFFRRLKDEKPPHSFFQSVEASWLDPVGHTCFEIRESQSDGDKLALVLPDISTCSDCLGELFNPANRRYRYPFINCTNCGPRFSIIEQLPYDRANTSMKCFTMCAACQAEYNDPLNRRFHAQPNACPACGPQTALWDEAGEARATGDAALIAAANAIRTGKIIALKGLGGFQLIVDARNDNAVQCLRHRKRREGKPFALLFPDLASVKAACDISAVEARSLVSVEAPIMLLRRRLNAAIADSIAPGNPYLGTMLPYTPLHHLLMAELKSPVVATSGNLSDEPICTDEGEALARLHGIADLFLVHNRPIVRHVDDSIVRIVLNREMILRRARGYAPLPITLGTPPPEASRPSVLAVGAHLKNAIALSAGDQVFLSQHIGDLETEEAYRAFRRVVSDFQKLYDTNPQLVAVDLHPDYLSTKFAPTLTSASGKPPIGVQHHVAHVFSCMAENEIAPPVLGVAWDGTGYGTDGSIWGGEFFSITEGAVQRIAHFRPFRLPGGEQAIKEPRRTALGLLFELYGESAFERSELGTLAAFSKPELGTLKTMLQRSVNSPLTTSAGRLFDGIASLIGLRQKAAFEGQAAMELEFALDGVETTEAYPFPVLVEDDVRSLTASKAPGAESPYVVSCNKLLADWTPMLEALVSDLKRQTKIGVLSARFHNALVLAILAVAKHSGLERVVLSGGCFQNRYLTEQTVHCLREAGFQPYWHQRVPPNDGGIALGQVIAVWRQKQ